MTTEPDSNDASPSPETAPAEPPTIDAAPQSRNVPGLCATAIVCSFFLPWTKNIMSATGFDLQKLGGNWQVLWLIPGLAALVLLVTLGGTRNKPLEQFAGALPLLGLVFLLCQDGYKVFEGLAPAAYVTVLCGLIMWFTPRGN